MPRAAARATVGHETEAIYRCYAIADDGMLKARGETLAALHRSDIGKKASSVVPVKRTI